MWMSHEQNENLECFLYIVHLILPNLFQFNAGETFQYIAGALHSGGTHWLAFVSSNIMYMYLHAKYNFAVI